MDSESDVKRELARQWAWRERFEQILDEAGVLRALAGASSPIRVTEIADLAGVRAALAELARDMAPDAGALAVTDVAVPGNWRWDERARLATEWFAQVGRARHAWATAGRFLAVEKDNEELWSVHLAAARESYGAAWSWIDALLTT